MTVITIEDGSPLRAYYLEVGHRLIKQGTDAVPAYSMSGMLYHKKGHGGDWMMLAVPNALVHGVFSAMDEPGLELPPSGEAQRLVAHISVMRPEELAKIGGPNRVTERGKRFRYRLGGLTSVEPRGWPEMAQCWMLRVHSPELQALRRSYGLSSLPKEGKYDFHVTVAVRRKNVLGRNETGKE